MLCHRVPLVRKKSLRQNLIEHGLLEDFLKKHTPNPASKFFPKEAATLVDSEPLENYLDVSAWAGRVVGAALRTWPRGERGPKDSWRIHQSSEPPGSNPRVCSLDLRGTGKAVKLTVRDVALIDSFRVYICRAPPYVPGTVLHPGKAAGNKTRHSPCPHGAHSLVGRDHHH